MAIAKKYDRTVTIEELVKQVRKYRSALEKCLNAQFPGERSKDIEIVCVLGTTPIPRDEPKTNRQVSSQYGARYVTYGDLVENSRKSYQEYLDKQKEVSELVALIVSLDETFETMTPVSG